MRDFFRRLGSGIEDEQTAPTTTGTVRDGGAAPGDRPPDPRLARRMESMDARLLLARRWAYLRYLHTKEALESAEGVRSVLVIGSGRGHAEIKLAMEFPDIHFHLTDVESDGTPYYQNAQRLASAWDLGNVTFGIRDILIPGGERYDMVLSVEVLEHIEDDRLAAAEMRAAAGKYVFALVPFAVDEANADPARRRRVWEVHGHHVVGYDPDGLRRLFPEIVRMRGCYWADRGGAHRRHLYDLSDDEIRANLDALREEARGDVKEGIPTRDGEARGIWMLARV